MSCNMTYQQSHLHKEAAEERNKIPNPSLNQMAYLTGLDKAKQNSAVLTPTPVLI